MNNELIGKLISGIVRIILCFVLVFIGMSIGRRNANEEFVKYAVAYHKGYMFKNEKGELKFKWNDALSTKTSSVSPKQ